MTADALTSFIEWLTPIAHNDTDKGIKYNPTRALWATVILSAFVTDHDGRCSNLRKEFDIEYINSDCFKEDLENVGCKIRVEDIRRSILS